MVATLAALRNASITALLLALALLLSRAVYAADTVWVDDAWPTGGTTAGTFTWTAASPTPVSGRLALQSDLAAGVHQHYVIGATSALQVQPGDTLFAHVFLDPANPPTEVMLQWSDGTWKHRAYWGAGNPITWAGVAMGALPPTGQWVRLEVPASVVGLEGHTVTGIAFTLYDGRATFDRAGTSNVKHVTWLDDSWPAGGTLTGGFTWTAANPTPAAGRLALQSDLAAGTHQHFVYGASSTIAVATGDTLFAHVYLDPANPPTEIMLQWYDGAFNHRAYWGAANPITWAGVAMGALPPPGQWVRLEVPAKLVSLEGRTVSGIAFTLYDGRAWWDYAGVTRAPVLQPQSITLSPATMRILGSPPFAVIATASSGLAVTLTSLTPSVCTLSASTVTLVATGTCTLHATQSGSASVAPAPAVDQSFAVIAPVPPGTADDVLFFDDAWPTGATISGAFTWVSSDPPPASGLLALQSDIAAGMHQQYFIGATAGITINPRDTLFAYVYLDPAHLPSQVMLQWSDTSWKHRAYWGPNLIAFPGTAMGGMPAAGQWVRLEVPASAVDLEGHTINGMAFTLYDGRATFDRAGVMRAPPLQAQTITFSGLPPRTLGSAPFAVSASASSGLPVTVTALTPAICSVNSSTVTLITAGTCTLRAAQAGNATFAAAANVDQSFGVAAPLATPQFVRWSTPADQFAGSKGVELVASATSNLPVSFSSLTPSTCTIAGTRLIPVAAGACSLRATQGGNAAWLPATADVSLTIRTGASGGVFALPLNYSSGASDGMTTADLDGDGRPDLAVADRFGLVSVLLNRGQGAFAPAAYYLAGDGASAIASGDFTRDGRADLAVANSTGQTLTVLVGSGGTFTSAAPVVIGRAAVDVSVTDINLDGTPDLVVASGTVNGTLGTSVFVAFGLGNGLFAAPTQYVTGPNPSRALATDVNGDGRPDLLVVHRDDATLAVMLNTGTGTFATSATLRTGAGPRALAVADVNRDGRPDIVVGNGGSADVSVFLARSDGTFAPAVRYVSGGTPIALAIADLDDDGFPDIVVANELENTVAVLRGNGDGTFRPALLHDVLPRPVSLVVADFDGDGLRDVAVNTVTGNVSVLLHAPVTPSHASLAIVAGNNQSAAINSAFAVSPAVRLVDTAGKPMAGVSVTFTAPASGASASFGSGPTTSAITNADGVATAPRPTANANVGTFAVSVTASGQSASLQLTNVGSAPVIISSVLPGATVGVPYSWRVLATGVPPPVLSLPVEALPPGLTFDAVSGLVAGQPTRAGLYAGSVKASNGIGPDAIQNFAVSVVPAAQTITFAPLADRTLDAPAFAVSATATSGLPVAFASQSPAVCRVDAAVVTMLDAGACVIRAAQPGNASYAAAVPVDRSFAVLPATVNRPPLVTLVEPLATAFLVAPAAVTLTAQASDPDGTIAKVEFYAGASLVAASTAAPYRVTWSGVMAGTYALQAIATDARGARSASPIVTVTVAPAGAIVTLNETAYALREIYGVAAADVDANGSVDVIAAGNASPKVMKGVGNGTLASVSLASGSAVYRNAVLRDINGDGRPDVLAWSSSGFVMSSNGNADGTFSPYGIVAGGENSADFVLADVNGDGKPDLVVVKTDRTLVTLLGNGDGTFRAGASQALAFRPEAISAADLNHDGKLDVVIARPDDRSVTAFINDGTGRFTQGATVAVGTVNLEHPKRVAIADFNGDGHADLAVPLAFSPNVAIALGRGDGTFGAAVKYPAGSFPDAIVAVDLNGDGKLDLALTNGSTTGELTILVGNGDGTFRAQQRIPVASATTALVAADLDRDGRPDLVVATQAGLSVFLNTTGLTTSAPIITSGEPADGWYGVPYRFAFSAAAVPAATFSLQSGTSLLQGGMTLSQLGVLDGSPLPDVYSAQVVARNGVDPDATQAFSLIIRRRNDPLSFPPLQVWDSGIECVTCRDVIAAPVRSGMPVAFTSLTPAVCTPNPDVATIADVVGYGRCILRALDRPNLIAPALLERVVDITPRPPTSKLVEPMDWARVTPGTSVKLRAATQSPVNGATLAQVEYFVDGSRIAAVTTPPFETTWTAVGAGVHQLTTRATYSLYVSGIPTQVVDAALPVMMVVTAAPEAFAVRLDVPALDGPLFAPATLPLSVTTTATAASIVRVDYFNGELLVGTSSSSPFGFGWTGIAPGHYTLRARATDSSGISAWSQSVDFDVEHDVAAPIAWYAFEGSWPSDGVVRDVVSGAHGRRRGAVDMVNAAATGKPDTCRAGNFAGGMVDLDGLWPVLERGERASVAFWMRWDGIDNAVPFTWAAHGLILSGGSFGFTTFNGDVLGIASTGLANGWHHVVAQFTNGDPARNVLYVDGVRRVLAQRAGVINSSLAYASASARIGAQAGNPATRAFGGVIDEVAIFAGPLSPARIAALYARTDPCTGFDVDVIAPLAVAGAPAAVELVAVGRGDNSLVSFDLYADGVLLGSGGSLSNRILWNNISAGTHVITALANGTGGSVAPSRPVSFTVTAGTTTIDAPPQVWLTAPSPGGIYVAPANIALSALPNELGGRIAVVEFLAGGTVVGTSTAAPYTLVWSAPAGVHSLSARVVDGAGRSAVSTAVIVVVRAPSLALTGPVQDAQFTVGDNVTLRVAGVAAPGVSRVDFLIDGTLVNSAAWSTLSNGDGSATLAWKAAGVGSHAVMAKLVMQNGQLLASEAVTINVRDVPPPPPPPSGSPPSSTALALALTAGLDGKTVGDDNAAVSGVVQAPANAVVTVNGRMALLDGSGNFLAEGVDLASGDNSIVVAVSAPGVDTVTRTVRMTSTGSAPFAVTLDADQGLAPLTVNVGIANRGNVPFKRVELSSRADLVPDETWTSLPDGQVTWTYVFGTPGLGTIRVRVFDDAERVIYDSTRHVLVRDPRDLAGVAVGVFDAMREALRRGDSAGALALVSGGMRTKYATVFNALQGRMSTIVDQLGSVQEITVTHDLAEIALMRSTPAGAQVFHVYVIRSEDGIWRIDGM